MNSVREITSKYKTIRRQCLREKFVAANKNSKEDERILGVHFAE